jgi:hypothetical protein
MTTVYVEGVWRAEITATKPAGGTQISPILLIPEGVEAITLYVVGSAAATACVEESPSSAAEILTPSGDLWMSVDATLDSVGATLVAFELGTRTVMALRLSSLVDDETATLIAIGRKVT